MFELGEQFGIDFRFDFLPAQTARTFKAEHQRRAPALQSLAPDAHRGPHADVALIHFIHFGLFQPFRPADDHPFAFDFHFYPCLPCRGRTCPALNLSVIAAMPYSSGPGMPGPYGAAQQPLRLRGVEDAAPCA